MFCAYCGSPMDEGSVFCGKCGKRVGEPDSASCVLGGRQKGGLRGRWIPKTDVVRNGENVSISTKKLIGRKNYNLEQSDIVGVHTKSFTSVPRIVAFVICLLLACSVFFGAPLYYVIACLAVAAYQLWVGHSTVIVITTRHGKVEIPVRYENEIERLNEVLGRDEDKQKTLDEVLDGESGASDTDQADSGRRPVVSKKVKWFVGICLLFIVFFSYRYALFFGVGGNLSYCLGKNISEVKLLHAIKESWEDNWYYVWDEEYYLKTDEEGIVVSIYSDDSYKQDDGWNDQKYCIDDFYIGQSEEEVRDITEKKSKYTVVYDDSFYLIRKGSSDSGRYIEIEYRDSEVDSLVYVLDEDLEDRLKEDAYTSGVALYKKCAYIDAQKQFEQLDPSYKDTKVYLDKIAELPAMIADKTWYKEGDVSTTVTIAMTENALKDVSNNQRGYSLLSWEEVEADGYNNTNKYQLVLHNLYDNKNYNASLRKIKKEGAEMFSRVLGTSMFDWVLSIEVGVQKEYRWGIGYIDIPITEYYADSEIYADLHSN